MDKEAQVTLSLGDVDNLLFKVLAAEFNTMYPNETRMALKAAMHVCDVALAEFEVHATRQAKSMQARAAAQARYAGTPPPAVAPVAAAPAPSLQAPLLVPPPAAPPAVKRTRRTKAEMEADRAALAAAQAAQAGAPVAQIVPPTAPPAPVIDSFAALAAQVAAGTVPQFAPTAPAPGTAPNFGVPPPSFG